jgi:hypothetical protein
MMKKKKESKKKGKEQVKGADKERIIRAAHLILILVGSQPPSPRRELLIRVIIYGE